MKKRTVSLSALLISAALAAPGVLAASSTAPSNPKLAGLGGYPGAEKLTGGLLQAATKATKNKTTLREELSRGIKYNELNGEIVVELQVREATDDLVAQVKKTGATVVSVAGEYNRITVTVSSSQTALALAQIDGVTLVMPVIPPRTNAGSVESGARPAMRVDAAASKYSTPQAFGKVLDGEGQRVGVISDSFNGLLLQSGVLSGDLPADTVILKNIIGTDEGAAMAELVHDVAPAAGIRFYSGAVSESDFALGIDTLVTAGCTVITDDLRYFSEPYYCIGPIARAAQRAVESGVPFYSAAGNLRNDALRQIYKDVSGENDGPYPRKGKDLHKWSNGTGFLPIVMPPFSDGQVFLYWNQPQDFGLVDGGAQVDLDMYVTKTPDAQGIFEATTNVTYGTASVNIQGTTGAGFGNPFEACELVNYSATPQTLYVAVDHIQGSKGNIPQAPVPLEFTVVFVPKNSSPDGVEIAIQGIDHHDNSTGASTIWGHSIAPGVNSVAAISYAEPLSEQTPDNFIGPSPRLDPEPFTSKGGQMTIPFNHMGFYLPTVTYEPDITSVDGTNTTFFGGGDFDVDGNPNFFGTSAAAPNAAGVAALLLELNPALTPSQIDAAFAETAIDITGERAHQGIDDATGPGLIDALGAVTYVFHQYGILTTTPAEQQESFVFQSDSEGWIPESAPGFTPIGFSLNSDWVDLTTTNNHNTLGWLKSPDFAGSQFVQPVDPDNPGPAPIAITGTTGVDSLYRATFRLSASTPDASQTPVFRMRQSTRSFDQSTALAVTSVGDASLAPFNGPEKIYKHYFALPSGQSRFNLYFDLLGFDSSDAGGVTFALNEVDIEGLSTSNLTNYKHELLKNFSGNANGWSKRNVSSFGNVGGSVTSTGLSLGPADPNQTSFAFWSGPDDGGDFTLEANRLYRVTFRLRSSAAVSAKTTVPTFRLRANDSSNQMAAIVDVNSTVANAIIPTGLSTANYYLYFATPAELIKHKVRLSFDYIFVPGVGDDPNVKVTLEELKVESYSPPLGPQ
ncbi:S8 family serine peptidase [Candidatus Sumerlaeota bacterium]|nr:S8 family serine peptidase [Candidatus Sumerlaeota bacterium]